MEFWESKTVTDSLSWSEVWFLCRPPLWMLVACVASVSVQFRSKERGTRVKDRAKSGTVFSCSETKRKRLLRRLECWWFYLVIYYSPYLAEFSSCVQMITYLRLFIHFRTKHLCRSKSKIVVRRNFGGAVVSISLARCTLSVAHSKRLQTSSCD